MITKICPISNKEFVITDDDLKFYEKMGVPTPTLCPEERQRRRWAWRGKYFSLRPCVKCGRNAMSYFAPENTKVETLCETCFQSDDFDASEFSQDFDFNRPFFEQFNELYKKVPKNAGNIGPANENSQFIICSSWNQNCYLCDETDNCRDCAFSYNLQKCEDVLESIYVRDSRIGYRLLKAENCYAVFFAQNVFHCSESAFVQSCRSCKNCLFCTDLQNQEYFIFNKKVSKEEFEQTWNAIFTGDRNDLQKAIATWEQFLSKNPTQKSTLIQTEDCTGRYITQSKNCNDCYYIDNCRDCRYCSDIHFSRDCYDVNIYEGEQLYECLHAGPKGYDQAFSQLLWFGSSIWYSIELWHCQDCFGCTGLKKKQYHILNKPYSKEEYFALREKIVNHMKNTGEWGEFFPIEYSPHSYNHTMAQRFFPESEESIQRFKMSWDTDWGKRLTKASNISTDVPEKLKNVSEDLTHMFICSETGKKFRFIPTEVKFYKQWNIPLPTNDPIVRIENLWEVMVQQRILET